MYENYSYKGKTIAEWQKLLHNEYSQYELYLMAKAGRDLE